ncbi:MAG: hypothetical protein ABIH03_10025, partial [Pseudomonadota bacterium]
MALPPIDPLFDPESDWKKRMAGLGPQGIGVPTMGGAEFEREEELRRRKASQPVLEEALRIQGQDDFPADVLGDVGRRVAEAEAAVQPRPAEVTALERGNEIVVSEGGRERVSVGTAKERLKPPTPSARQGPTLAEMAEEARALRSAQETRAEEERKRRTFIRNQARLLAFANNPGLSRVARDTAGKVAAVALEEDKTAVVTPEELRDGLRYLEPHQVGMKYPGQAGRGSEGNITNAVTAAGQMQAKIQTKVSESMRRDREAIVAAIRAANPGTQEEWNAAIGRVQTSRLTGMTAMSDFRLAGPDEDTAGLFRRVAFEKAKSVRLMRDTLIAEGWATANADLEARAVIDGDAQALRREAVRKQVREDQEALRKAARQGITRQRIMQGQYNLDNAADRSALEQEGNVPHAVLEAAREKPKPIPEADKSSPVALNEWSGINTIEAASDAAMRLIEANGVG